MSYSGNKNSVVASGSGTWEIVKTIGTNYQDEGTEYYELRVSVAGSTVFTKSLSSKEYIQFLEAQVNSSKKGLQTP